MKKKETYGFLQTCIDRRFIASTRALFEEKTGLHNAAYWHESIPAGSSIDKQDTLGEDFAKSQGVTIFCWQAHGDVCGGQPQLDNETIYAHLLEIVQAKKRKFPNDTHYLFFATEKEMKIEEI